MATEGIPGFTGTLDDEKYREQQRVARDEKVARREQEIADDKARKNEASRNSCLGPKGTRTSIESLPCQSKVLLSGRRWNFFLWVPCAGTP